MQTTEAAVRLDETPERKLDRIIYIAAMNFKAEGGGVPMAPKADATDGKLSICSVHGIPKWRTFYACRSSWRQSIRESADLT